MGNCREENARDSKMGMIACFTFGMFQVRIVTGKDRAGLAKEKYGGCHGLS
ncbi:MAG: hypothetical protein PUD04_09760 [Firmicutes bacterium]|nr:hypothetical protein [Bacillota bacterium]